MNETASRPGWRHEVAATGWRAPVAAAARQGPRAVVLVEGVSDRQALEALAIRRGRDLAAEGVEVVPLSGATNITRALLDLTAAGGITLAGLCDEGEVGAFRRGLERAGLGAAAGRNEMAALGFHVCVVDLEDELIRTLGPDVVEEVVKDQDELRALRTFQRQPAQRGRGRGAQLRRFLGTRSGRKAQYAPLLVDALDLEAVPFPLDAVLAHVEVSR